VYVNRINIQAVCMQDKSERRSNKERAQSTRADLISAARKLFYEDGYAQTPTPQIVKAAKITRGALYHHFTDKSDLFRAVFLAEAHAVAKQIGKNSTNSKSALDALLRGSEAYFTAMAVPGRTRLMLLDGPSVLGQGEIDHIYSQTSRKQLLNGLSQAMAKGELRKMPLKPLAILLSAAFDRAALAITEGESTKSYKTVIRNIIEGLR